MEGACRLLLHITGNIIVAEQAEDYIQDQVDQLLRHIPDYGF